LIDIYFIHHFDEDTPLVESIRALDDLIKQGKILHIGASNFAAWQIMKGVGISDREHLSKFEIIQPMYNLIKRQAEVEILPMALSENLGVISYSPLGGGLLTGKYNKIKQPKNGRFINNEMYKKRYEERWMFDVADKFSSLAKTHGFSPAALAISWVANNQAITSPIIGARNLEQLEESLGSLDITMTESLYEKISDLSPKPPNATDRTEEML